jgi:glutaredoxin
MALNTNKYKLSIYTETSCDACKETKKILTDNNIPFQNKCITVTSTELKKENGDTRWEYIDAEREHHMAWYTPVLIIEDKDGDITYVPTVKDASQHLLGQSMDGPEDVLNVLKPYLI